MLQQAGGHSAFGERPVGRLRQAANLAQGTRELELILGELIQINVSERY